MQIIAKRIELFFWNTTIPLLSESELIRNLVKQFYKLYYQFKSDLWVALLVLTCGMMGLVVGRVVAAAV
jgi:hypothetical protein